MPLQVYSTLTRTKAPFEPVRAGRVGMYVCGPTVYKPSHVGHMVGPVIFDTVKRYLTWLGYQVTFVVNITDVDDKLIVKAKELGTSVADLAEKMTADYLECLKRLNVTGIDRMPKATEHIPQIIEMIQGLIAKGAAYPVAGGDVYFDIGKDHDYGKLCNRDPAQLEAGVRLEVNPLKRNSGDFALWKAAKPGEPSWESPWGAGRPGWHIECSAMSRALLGDTLDIHGGGLDLQFPHHENELAQSESFTDAPFARYWMHNGLMKIRSQAGKVGGRPGGAADGEAEKMSGSLGNVINVADVLQKHHPETLRFLLLSSHYRSPIEYGEDRLAELRRGLDGFYRFFERYTRITGGSFYGLPVARTADPLPGRVAEAKAAFTAAMDDDFNTAGAIGSLYDLLSVLNRHADEAKLEETRKPGEEFTAGVALLRELGDILGLFAEPVPKAEVGGGDELVGKLVALLIEVRAEARKAKQYALGDLVRKRLGEVGVLLEDRPGGVTDWRRA